MLRRPRSVLAGFVRRRDFPFPSLIREGPSARTAARSTQVLVPDPLVAETPTTSASSVWPPLLFAGIPSRSVSS